MIESRSSGGPLALVPPPVRSVLVYGATGRQGGAVARRLLDRGHRVRALTRTPDSLAARKLARLGAEIAAGDVSDSGSLVEAMRDIDCVFALGAGESGSIDETIRGRAMVDAALVARVAHLIYSSVANANTRRGVRCFSAKYAVETYLRSSAVPSTVLGPVMFMESLKSPAVMAALHRGLFSLGPAASRNLDLLALEDFASFVLMVVEHLGDFTGVRVDLASDSISGSSVAETLARSLKQPIHDSSEPVAAVPAGDPLIEWIGDVGFRVSTRWLHARYPGVGWRSFDAWAAYQDWNTSSLAALG